MNSNVLQRLLKTSTNFTGFASDRYGADVTQLYDAKSFNQLFSSARPMRVTVNESSRTMDHTVESGATITDHRVINPVQIRIEMLLSRDEYRSTYAGVKNLFVQGSLIGVQTKTSTFRNMLVKELPHEEDAELFDVIPMSITLIEVKFAEAKAAAISADKTADPEYVDTVNSGKKNPIVIGTA